VAFKHTVFAAGIGALAATGADRWLRQFARGCGLILMLHHVRPQRSREFAPNQALEITPDFLEFALVELLREGFELIQLDAVPERLQPGSANRPFAVLTFDDGYRDNVEHAWPVLRRHNAPWTVFVATDFLDGNGRLWWLELEDAISRLDKVSLSVGGALIDLPARTPTEKQHAFKVLHQKLRAAPEHVLESATAGLAALAGVDPRRLVREICLGWDEVQDLAREPDVCIGAHSISHPVLVRCDRVTAMREIAESKAHLERRLGKPVRHLAYPFGDPGAVGAREFDLARQAGYLTAVTTRPGHLFREHSSHLHELPRVSLNRLFHNEIAFRSLLSGVPFWIWNRRRVVTR
jgi:peptidoglycan/xylan/chitin deacetylase (PgdA/CDA1 family)